MSGGTITRLARTGRPLVAMTLLVLYPLARTAVAALGLAHWLGAGWGVVIVLLVACLRWTVLLQAAALLALVSLWHWPIVVAVVVVAPRLILILPGLVNTWLATLRHPRPRWEPWVPAEPRAAAELPAPVARGMRSTP